MVPLSQELMASGLLQDPGVMPLGIGVAEDRDPRPQYLLILRQSCRGLLSMELCTQPMKALMMLIELVLPNRLEAVDIPQLWPDVYSASPPPPLVTAS